MFKNGVLIIGLDNRVTVDKSGTPITGLSKQQQDIPTGKYVHKQKMDSRNASDKNPKNNLRQKMWLEGNNLDTT